MEKFIFLAAVRDKLTEMNLPQESGFESTEGNYDLKEIRRIVHALPKDLPPHLAWWLPHAEQR